MAEPPKSTRIYFHVYLGLLALAVGTTAVAFADLGRFSLVVALAIASMKTGMVLLYFMHVRFGSGAVRLFAGAGFFFLLILGALTLGDVVTRDWMEIPVPR